MPDENVPVDLRTDRPTPARMYDYFLGGKNNFAVDRKAAEQVLALAPETRHIAQDNRAFLHRAVHFLAAEAGIRQFIDIGAGLPTQGNVHEIAKATDPTARVVYVDNDPIVRVHAQPLLHADDTTTIIEADMRDPQAILDHPNLRRLIDLDQPIAVLFISVLHFIIDDDDPCGIVRAFRDAGPSGSYLALSHATMPERNGDGVEAAAKAYSSRATSSTTLRPPSAIQDFFDGCQLLEPGLVPMQRWRPDDPDAVSDDEVMLGGVGRKR